MTTKLVALSMGDVTDRTIAIVNEAGDWGLAVSTALLGVMMTTALLRLFLQKL
ncbi:hypothetical protein Oscil6304_1539 [Oscillatoria acuminata PCC 6304]|uniref:Uncharacterized protein n=1 Tax=Oscillatoria acuminata PCC 6304 TaxID=56110 RepID=K9TEE2_9CYAN|nr:hypothetical protein Oscil6304_1539 [Oscillatoria acuminata PCC 6304]